MVGISEALRKLQERIRSAASSELSVLIIGDTGSGKELVAVAAVPRQGAAAIPGCPGKMMLWCTS